MPELPIGENVARAYIDGRNDGRRAEHTRVRRELLREIASLKASDRHFLTSRLDSNGVMTAALHEDDIRAALDRICPDPENAP